MKTKTRLAGLAALLAMAVIGSATQMSAQDVRLAARTNKTINGVEAELRGDYRERANIAIRLNAELDNIHLPLGQKVAFCLLQNGGKRLIGVGKVVLIAGRPVAEVERSASDGQNVLNVNSGDVLQAHQSAKAPFVASPGCGAPLLVSAIFR